MNLFKWNRYADSPVSDSLGVHIFNEYLGEDVDQYVPICMWQNWDGVVDKKIRIPKDLNNDLNLKKEKKAGINTFSF